jgi:hypothetical protein
VCFFIVLKISFSNSLSVEGKRLIGHTFWGYFGSLPGFRQNYDFCFLPRWRKVTKPKVFHGKAKAKTKLLCDWQFTAKQFVLASSLMRPTTRNVSFQLNPGGNSLYATSSLTRRWVGLLWICWAFNQEYVSHIQHVIENCSFCTTHKSSVSTGFAKIMPILLILWYNGSLVTWKVVSLNTAKFKSLIVCMLRMHIRCKGDAFTEP